MKAMKNRGEARTKESAVILVVEDDHSLSEAYQLILRKVGYTVHVAFNGAEGLKLAEQVKPALILLDLRMPVMDGLEFLRRYQPLDKHLDVRIIVFSNYDMQKEIDEAYQLGADRYFMKALASPNELIQAVRATLANE